MNRGRFFRYLALFFLVSCFLTGISGCLFKKSAPVHLPYTIVVLGSSSAYGIGADPFDSSWVNKLTDKLSSVNSGIEVINLGYPGYNTYHIQASGFKPQANRNPPDKERNITFAMVQKPDFVIINLPSNDIVNRHTDEEIMRNYKRVTTVLEHAKIPFLITAAQPRDVKDDSIRLRLKNFSKVLLKNYQPSLVIDYFRKLSSSKLYIRRDVTAGDSIHVNNKGHDIIYHSFLAHPAIQKIIALK